MAVKVLVIFLIAVAVIAPLAFASPFFEEDENEQLLPTQQDSSDVAYIDSTAMDGAAAGADPDLMDNAQKRSCIRRGGSCDHRRNDCCFSSSCRCNLWGSNCRCHRAGLFQKWG